PAGPPPARSWNERSGPQAAVRQQPPEGRGMFADPPMVGRAVIHDQGRGASRGTPAEPTGNTGREPPLSIECAQRVADVDDLRLDLDDEERAGRVVPSQDVDQPAFSGDAERELGPGDPAAVDEGSHDGID